MKNIKNIVGVFIAVVLFTMLFFPASQHVQNSLPLIKIAETENTQFFMQGDEMIKRVLTGTVTRDFIVKIFAGKTFLIPLDGEKILGMKSFEFLKFFSFSPKEKIALLDISFFISSLVVFILQFLFYKRKIPWKEDKYNLASIVKSREWFVFNMIPLRNK